MTLTCRPNFAPRPLALVAVFLFAVGGAIAQPPMKEEPAVVQARAGLEKAVQAARRARADWDAARTDREAAQQRLDVARKEVPPDRRAVDQASSEREVAQQKQFKTGQALQVAQNGVAITRGRLGVALVGQHVRAGDTAFRQGNFDQAVEDYTEAFNHAPRNSQEQGFALGRLRAALQRQEAVAQAALLAAGKAAEPPVPAADAAAERQDARQVKLAREDAEEAQRQLKDLQDRGADAKEVAKAEQARRAKQAQLKAQEAQAAERKEQRKREHEERVAEWRKKMEREKAEKPEKPERPIKPTKPIKPGKDDK
jgi:hypothetical protein